MKDVIKKGFLIGLGMTVLSKQKLQAELKRFLKENDISAAEANKAAQEFLKDVKKYQSKAAKVLKKELLVAEKELRRKARMIARQAKPPVKKKKVARKCSKRS